MKINGPNHSNLNPYRKNIQKQQDMPKSHTQSDKLEISNQAKQLQENNKSLEARQKRVEDLKNQVQSGNYHVDAQKSAKSIIKFWTNN
ncbi:flagellar biosynthesis anti-sigma factor FlgM [Pontibacillus salicampi]|uniref:Negative regulator of flagellin synthesis n=1 Tax=Pontibacillus salicampi TaxID=1449801 RepID=A0ABV6LT39_9BACI